jgi:hypothetical protein
MDQFSLDIPKEGFIDITAKVRELIRHSFVRYLFPILQPG